jgi:competence protein ComGC
MINKNLQKQAFTVIELAVVIIVIAVLMITTISSSKSLNVNAKNKITKDKMRIIYLSLGQYLVKNKKLPLPVPLTLTKSNIFTDTATSSCNLGTADLCYGGVPIKELELPIDLAIDGFDNKIEYILLKSLNTSYVSSVNKIEIAEKMSGADKVIVAVNSRPDVAIVLMSRGENNAYAYSFENCTTTQCNKNSITSPSSSEQNNHDIVHLSSQFNKFYIADYDDPNFDDIILYKIIDDFNFDFNQHILTKCTTQNAKTACNGLVFNNEKDQLDSASPAKSVCYNATTQANENVRKKVKCYQADYCRYTSECRLKP